MSSVGSRIRPPAAARDHPGAGACALRGARVDAPVRHRCAGDRRRTRLRDDRTGTVDAAHSRSSPVLERMSNSDATATHTVRLRCVCVVMTGGCRLGLSTLRHRAQAADGVRRRPDGATAALRRHRRSAASLHSVFTARRPPPRLCWARAESTRARLRASTHSESGVRIDLALLDREIVNTARAS